MVHSVLTLVTRAFVRNLSFTLVTIGSLVVGMIAAIFILLWVSREVTYDRAIPANDRVYAVFSNDEIDGRIETSESTPFALTDYVSRQVSAVEATTRIDNCRAQFTHTKIKLLKDGAYVDKQFFDVFHTEVEVNSNNPLPDKNAIAISQSLAALLFRDDNALGQTVTLDDNRPFRVTAVYRDFPENTSLSYVDYVLPFDATSRDEGDWQNLYIKLRNASDATLVKQQIDHKLRELTTDQSSTCILFPLRDWRLRWHFENGQPSGGRITYVIIFTITALFVLIMACVNYVNLTTARAAKRAKEIGIRKVSGATRRVLIYQFMTESILLACGAAAIALVIVYTTLPLFNQTIGTKLTIDLQSIWLYLGLAVVTLFAGVVAGWYPALLLSSMHPASVLKGNFNYGHFGVSLRKALVVFQFTLSIIVVFCALIMWQQTDFLLKRDLGFDKHNVINVWLDDYPDFPLESVRAELLKHPAIEAASYAGASPIEINGYSEVTWANKPAEAEVYLYGASVDYEYLPTLKFEITRGRNFSHDYAQDSLNFIINEKAVAKMGLIQPIGQKITYGMYGDRTGEIIGVIKDFNNDDIHVPIRPVVLLIGKARDHRNLLIRYRSGVHEAALKHLIAVFHQFQPDQTLAYSFLDEDFEHQHGVTNFTRRLFSDPSCSPQQSGGCFENRIIRCGYERKSNNFDILPITSLIKVARSLD